MPWSSATASSFSSTTRALRISAALLWILAKALPGPVFKLLIRTQAEPVAVGRHSKRRRKSQSGSGLELANRNPLARLDGLRHLSLRRTVRTPRSAPDQLLCLDHRHFVADRIRIRGLAGQFLHLQSTGAAGQLSHSAKAAQDRAAETF